MEHIFKVEHAVCTVLDPRYKHTKSSIKEQMIVSGSEEDVKVLVHKLNMQNNSCILMQEEEIEVIRKCINILEASNSAIDDIDLLCDLLTHESNRVEYDYWRYEEFNKIYDVKEFIGS